MARQVWGTYSVRDHLEKMAFVRDVMLYDRLVIPVPSDDSERKRWEEMGWQPKRLDRVLEILGDRAVQVPWTPARRASWKTRYDAGVSVAQQTPDYAFALSRTELTQGLPEHVTGVQAVPTFSRIEDIEAELQFADAPAGSLVPGGAAVTVIAHEFLVPYDDADEGDHCLRMAVELASDKSYRRKRAAFWRWLREYYSDDNMCHTASIRDAAEEAAELLEEQRSIVRKERIKTASAYAFTLGAMIAGWAAAGPVALVASGMFISFGKLMVDRLVVKPDEPRELVLLHDIQRHFGWTAEP